MKNDLNKNRMGLKKRKMSPFIIILCLLVGAFFYFGYYVVMTDYFKVNPLSFPYLILSIYFVFATIFFPYSGNKVSVWLENSPTFDLFVVPVMSMPFAYIIAPFVFISGFFKTSKNR